MSELPWLKRKNQQGGTPAIHETRTPDSGTNNKALAEGTAEELLQALSRKDFKGIRESLKALISLIKEER
jgi:hypothetical protein